MQRLKIEPGNYAEYETKIQQKIIKSGIIPEYGIIKKGDIIIWHANLIHGGSKRNNINLTRKSVVIHYFFKNCKYWTPILSGPKNIIYRNPSDFVDKKFGSKTADDKTNDIMNDIMNAKKYKIKYPDLQNLSDEQAIEHYYKYGIYENRKFD
jgi:hypothetical protein